MRRTYSYAQMPGTATTLEGVSQALNIAGAQETET